LRIRAALARNPEVAAATWAQHFRESVIARET
jgi:hypothetical protein